MRKLFNGLLWILGTLLVLGVVLRALVLDVWVVPNDPSLGASVAPSLAPGDAVVVLTRGTPGFGELVRCPDPETPGDHIVGRIAGLPGDTVDVDHSTLDVNGQRYDPEMACAEPTITITDPATGNPVQLSCDMVMMGPGLHPRATGRRPPLERRHHVEVRPDTVFLLSDNRSYHDDSRDFGLQPRAACNQRIVFRLWGGAGWSDDQRRFTFVR
ncbi:signal peptidase I [Sorangium sp. So ce1000]|uniref:signal peptidase I n=1 Tax=Sorangium sp. So ce1000 TaxID=3133325 RepID=UPI003F608759